MASQKWRTNVDIIIMKKHNSNIAEHLYANPQAFNFFQAVRLLDTINHEKVAYKPNWKQHPVGYDTTQKKETVRFKIDPSLKYPDGHITTLQEAEINPAKNSLHPAVAHISFMGLTGPSGVLPMHYSELILEQNRNKDYAMRDFFDLFNHRTVSLHYRGWEKYRVQYNFERVRREGQQTDNFSKLLKSLTGLTQTNQHVVTDDSLLFYAGHFAQKRRSAASLESVLSDYFAVPVKLEQFIGSWNRLQDSECTRTPSKDIPHGQFNRLGKDTIIGKRVWYSQGKFRLQLGPLSQTQFKQFLPGSDGLKKLKQITDTYISPELNYDIQLISEEQNIPQCQLASNSPPRLGYFTWLRGHENTKLQHDKLVLV